MIVHLFWFIRVQFQIRIEWMLRELDVIMADEVVKERLRSWGLEAIFHSNFPVSIIQYYYEYSINGGMKLYCQNFCLAFLDVNVAHVIFMLSNTVNAKCEVTSSRYGPGWVEQFECEGYSEVGIGPIVFIYTLSNIEIELDFMQCRLRLVCVNFF